MSSFASMFNPTIFMVLGIMILVVACLVLYFENKSRQQNHKISSMLSLVSSLAEEINAIKYARGGGSIVQPQETKLIDVSDGEDEEDEEDEEEDDDEEDEDDDEVSECGSCIDCGTIMILEDTDIMDNSTIKVLKLLGDNEMFEDEKSDDESDDDKSDDEDDDESVFSEDETAIVQDLKMINISADEEVLDYKKMTVGKLRSIVTEKQLCENPSKLKKQELLKLLGSD